MLNPGVDMSKPARRCKICVVSRLKTATPLQVKLKVKIAEVNRSLLKQIGVNLLARDPTSGFQFGIGQGAGTFDRLRPRRQLRRSQVIQHRPTGTTLGAAGKLFGLDILASLDLAENDGLVTILAEPNLTALSGETASFLAGGEFPIPISQSARRGDHRI